MQVWKKIVFISIVAAVVLMVGGISLYNFIIVPKYIEPVLVSASGALRNADVQDAITDIAQDLADRGIISEDTLKNYVRQAKKYTTEEKEKAKVSAKDTQKTPSKSNEEEEEETDITAAYAKSSLGVKQVKDRDKNKNEDIAINESYSKKYSDSESKEELLDDDESQVYTFDQNSAESAISAEVEEAIANTRAKNLYNKIVGVMSTREKAVFFSVIGKADTGKLMDLYQGENKSGAKQYLQTILGDEEYSDAVEIFFKYAPLLLED